MAIVARKFDLYYYIKIVMEVKNMINNGTIFGTTKIFATII